MDLRQFITLCLITAPCTGVRLHKIFQLIDGHTHTTSSNNSIQGFLHIGNDYSVLIKAPTPTDKYLTYELYETKNIPNSPTLYGKPRKLAVSQIPVEYIKDQLRTFRDELHKATFKDDSLVPGTQVETMREWQIEKALRIREENGEHRPLRSEPLVLRMLD